MKYILSLYSLLISISLFSQSATRNIQKINDGWLFSKNENSLVKWETVTIPHTWNIADVMDDTPGYYRGIGYYKRKLIVSDELKAKQLYVFFEGANQVTEVFVNGKSAGTHSGGYAGFYIPITGLVKNGENDVLVKVDNSYNAAIPPLSADFTFFGGIYRDVYLVALDKMHFATNDFGSNAVFITTPVVTAEKSIVQVKAKISNRYNQIKRVLVQSTIKNAQGKIVTIVSSKIIVGANKEEALCQQQIRIKNPRLWSPENPYLYVVRTELKDVETGKLLDVIENPLGFRWFHFDAAKGFFLNGSPYKLVGTSRHQDYKNMGNAVPDSLAVKDICLLKEMGGNFLRVAHYPQDPSVLKACDSLGILASVEIPVVNEITESDSFYLNCLNMQTEMIRQHYNHPSVIMWCYMNEVLLRPHYATEKDKQKVYFAAITRLAKNLDSITRKEDPYRYTMIANHGDYNKYKEVGLVDIPMVVGWNLYSGWYGANMNDFPAFLDSFHARHPLKPMLVSEYGADADPRIHSLRPVRFDKSVEYTTKFHQYYLKEMLARDFVAAAMIWNLADFNSETRTESMPHINNKGLLQWDRTAKDPYYYYKAMLSKKSFIKILGPDKISAIADKGNESSTYPIQVSGNVNEIELIVDGKNLGKQITENGIAQWNVNLKNGKNTIEATAFKEGVLIKDKSEIDFNLLPAFFNNQNGFIELNILLGADRSFIDSDKHVWISGKEYAENSWGFIGGRTFKINGNNRLPYGTDKNILGTIDDPIYQTQQIGIQKYQLDVPAGEYEISLHFAELLGGQVKEFPYNLSDGDRIEPNGKRVFSVFVNNKLILDNFNIAEQYGTATGVVKKAKLTVTDEEGIVIDFKQIEGEPVLNALQVKRVDIPKQPTQVTADK